MTNPMSVADEKYAVGEKVNKKSAGKLHLPSLISFADLISSWLRSLERIAGRLQDRLCQDAIKPRQKFSIRMPSADSPALLPAVPDSGATLSGILPWQA